MNQDKKSCENCKLKIRCRKTELYCKNYKAWQRNSEMWLDLLPEFSPTWQAKRQWYFVRRKGSGEPGEFGIDIFEIGFILRQRKEYWKNYELQGPIRPKE